MMTNYARVYDHIQGEITDGGLRPGDKLPSITELASQLAVGRSSVKTALMLLRERGIVQGHQGKGVYVAPPWSPARDHD